MENNFPSIDYLMQIIDEIDISKYCNDLNKVSSLDVENIAKITINKILKELEVNISSYRENYFWKILQKLDIYTKEYNNKSELKEYIQIINFNYDLILEKTLEIFMRGYNVDSIIYKNCLLLKEIIDDSHIYGKIGANGEGLKFMRNNEAKIILEYRKEFQSAKNLYFLGFGFDNQNLKNLGLLNPPTGSKRFNLLNNIYLTNFVKLKGEERATFSPAIFLKIQTIFGTNIDFLDYTQSCKISHKIGYNTRGRVVVSNLSCEDAIDIDFNFDV